MASSSPHSELLEIYEAALTEVNGERLVHAASGDLHGPFALVSLGKAAAAMTRGALASPGLDVVRGFVCHPHAYEPFTAPTGDWAVYRGGHPLPDAASFDAGAALVDWLAALPPSLPLLVLMSGGSSSCIEHLNEGVARGEVISRTRQLLSSGADIRALNAARSEWSALKRGRALRLAGLRDVHVLVLADVPGDDPAFVGSGPFYGLSASVHVSVVGSNRTLREAASAAAAARGFDVVDGGELRGDAARMGESLALRLRDAPSGIHLWGGETTVALPKSPGRGGRCQHLALAAAGALDGVDGITLLAAGSDGVDGSSDDAGALIDGMTAAALRDAGVDSADALARADSGSALEEVGALLHTGPTGTNLMDIVVALRA